MDVYRKVSVAEEMERNPELQQKDIDGILEWMKTLPYLPRITGSNYIA